MRLTQLYTGWGGVTTQLLCAVEVFGAALGFDGSLRNLFLTITFRLVSSGVMHLLVTVDRLFAILYPFKYRTLAGRKDISIAAATLAWTYSIVMCSLMFIDNSLQPVTLCTLGTATTACECCACLL